MRSPKQSVVGSTPTGLITQINNFFLVNARVCVLANARRTSAGKNFLPSIGNLCFAPLLALMAVFQHFAFFANTAVLANGRFA